MKFVVPMVEKSTALAPVNPVPVIVNAVPPPVVPEPGATPVTAGRGAVGWCSVGRAGRAGAAIVDHDHVHRVPAARGGVVAVIDAS